MNPDETKGVRLKLYKLLTYQILGLALVVVFPDVAIYVLGYLFGIYIEPGQKKSLGGERVTLQYVFYFFTLISILEIFVIVILRHKLIKFKRVLFILGLIPAILLYVWFAIDIFSPKSMYMETNLLVLKGDGVRVDRLLNFGLNPNKVFEESGVNRNRNTMLHFAVLKENKQMVEILLRHGADPHIKNNIGETPISIAESQGNKDILEMLIK